MNKKLIATAMGMVLAGGMGMANADVKLYGQIDVSIDAIDVDGGGDDINMGSNTSAIGVKGSEDLGNGMQAIFKLEWQTDVSESSSFTGRDQWIGLKGDSWGQLLFGTMSTSYKSAAAALDPFYRTRNQARNVGLQSILHRGKGEEGQGRATNTVRYDSPSFGGINFNGTYTLDNDETDGEDDDPYSVGLTYAGGPVYAFASYITTDSGGDDDAWQIGAKGTFGGAALWAMYEADGGLITTRSGGAVDDGDGLDIWNIGASYTMGNNLISLDYGVGDESDSLTAADDYTTWRIGAKHSFSKRTMAYITHAQQDFEDAGEVDLTSIGMRHNF